MIYLSMILCVFAGIGIGYILCKLKHTKPPVGNLIVTNAGEETYVGMDIYGDITNSEYVSLRVIWK